jgi:hypothetical protein
MIKKIYYLLFIFLITSLSLNAQTQGELRQNKNIQIGSAISGTNVGGISGEYFFSSYFSLGLRFNSVNQIARNENYGTNGNAFLHTKEINGTKGVSSRLIASIFPFASNGFFFSGIVGRTPSFFEEEKDNYLIGLNGDLSPLSPKTPYGQRIEQLPTAFIGVGTGYKHIFSNGLFFGGDISFNHLPDRIKERYSIFPDQSTFMSGAGFNPIEYLFKKQVALDNNHSPKKNFISISISFGIAF